MMKRFVAPIQRATSSPPAMHAIRAHRFISSLHNRPVSQDLIYSRITNSSILTPISTRNYSSAIQESTSKSSITPFVPGAPPTSQFSKEELDAIVYRGMGDITADLHNLPLEHVFRVVHHHNLRNFPAGQEERVLQAWLSAGERLKQQRQVQTLGELMQINRIVWWRTKIPAALRRSVNLLLYHNKWPLPVIEDLKKLAQKS